MLYVGVIYQHLALTLAMRRNLVFLPCVDFRRSVEIASISEKEGNMASASGVALFGVAVTAAAGLCALVVLES